MPLIAEDGTGVENANSYATVQQGDDYHAARLRSETWTAADQPTKEAALQQASAYLDAVTIWRGQRKTASQSLAFPRYGLTIEGLELPHDEIPKQVVEATCELARRLIDTDLISDQDSDNISEMTMGGGALGLKFRDDARTNRIPEIITEILRGIGSIPSGKGINRRPTIR